MKNELLLTFNNTKRIDMITWFIIAALIYITAESTQDKRQKNIRLSIIFAFIYLFFYLS
jgi:hypothetical protein